MKIIEGSLQPGDARFAVISTRWNDFIVGSLAACAVDTLRRHGVEDDSITHVRVPGAYELPLVADRLAATGKYEAVIALGCVIRGSTPHFDYVAGESAKGLGQAALKHGIPVAFGVLTTENIEQAIERAGTKAGNKGAEAAEVAIEMVNLLRQLDE